MKKYAKERKSGVLKAYLLILFTFVLISGTNLISKITRQDYDVTKGGELMGVVAIGLFIFSIYCLIKFRKQKLTKLTWVLPIWFIIEASLVIIVAIVLAILTITSRIIPELILASPTLFKINLIHEILQFSFIVYLLNLFVK